MSEPHPHAFNHPQHSAGDPDLSEANPTLDLNLDEFEGVNDLQALADEVAESTPESTVQVAPETSAQQREQEHLKAMAEQTDKHHRLLADFANYRNRVGRDIQLAVSLAERKLLMEFLPVVDSLERCLASTYTSVEDFHNGVALIHKQYTDALRKAGVEPVNVAVGDPFDAMHAEALTTTQQPGLPDGAVAAIYERGFKLREHLLRPARVIVNHNPSSEAAGADGSNPS
jgi:molecular chaperone GrpE